MEEFVVGDVVVVAFPFSDLSGKKMRPALVIARAEFDNYILCQITSRAYSSQNCIKITQSNFKSGGLPLSSYVRPDKIFTAEPKIIKKIAGKLDVKTRELILTKIRDQFVA